MSVTLADLDSQRDLAGIIDECENAEFNLLNSVSVQLTGRPGLVVQ